MALIDDAQAYIDTFPPPTVFAFGVQHRVVLGYSVQIEQSVGHACLSVCSP